MILSCSLQYPPHSHLKGANLQSINLRWGEDKDFLPCISLPLISAPLTFVFVTAMIYPKCIVIYTMLSLHLQMKVPIPQHDVLGPSLPQPALAHVFRSIVSLKCTLTKLSVHIMLLQNSVFCASYSFSGKLFPHFLYLDEIYSFFSTQFRSYCRR